MCYVSFVNSSRTAGNVNNFRTVSYGSGPDKSKNIWGGAISTTMGRSSFARRNVSSSVGATRAAGGAAAMEEDEENISEKYSSVVAECKADIFMLQMRHDKLVRFVSQNFNRSENATRSGLHSPKSVTLGESAIQDVRNPCPRLPRPCALYSTDPATAFYLC